MSTCGAEVDRKCSQCAKVLYTTGVTFWAPDNKGTMVATLYCDYLCYRKSLLVTADWLDWY